jgi:hypothetical protein
MVEIQIKKSQQAATLLKNIPYSELWLMDQVCDTVYG